MANDGDQELPELMAVEVDAELQALIDGHPLPAGVVDADMNQEELAAAFNSSVPTISKWHRTEKMPVAQEGGLGKPYVFRLSHCFAWKQARDSDERLRRNHSAAQANALQATFLGLQMEDPGATLTARQRTELANADITHSKAMQLRRQLVPLDDVVTLLESLLSMTRDSIAAMPDVLERELSLKPEEVSKVQRIGRDLLKGLADRIEEAELTERNIADVPVQSQWMV